MSVKAVQQAVQAVLTQGGQEGRKSLETALAQFGLALQVGLDKNIQQVYAAAQKPDFTPPQTPRP